MCVCVCVRAHMCTLSHVSLFMTPWTIVSQAPLSMGFSRQEYWSGLPFSPPGDRPNPGIKPMSLLSPALAGGFFTTAGSGPGKGVSMSLSTSGLPDMTGSVYNKTQTFGEQGFHSETPPSFSLPSVLGSTGPPAPRVAPGYAPPPFLHILPAHQQPHSPLLHPAPSAGCSELLWSAQPAPGSLQPQLRASKPAEPTLPTGQTEP